MGAFYESVGAMIVAADSYVIDFVFRCEIIECFDECWTVVGNDFAESSPSAKYIFENPVADRVTVLFAKAPEFWPTCE